jgi:hypothetical protein
VSYWSLVQKHDPVLQTPIIIHIAGPQSASHASDVWAEPPRECDAPLASHAEKQTHGQAAAQYLDSAYPDLRQDRTCEAEASGVHRAEHAPGLSAPATGACTPYCSAWGNLASSHAALMAWPVSGLAAHIAHQGALQRRSFSTASTQGQWSLEYTGVVSTTIRTLKIVSMGTALLSLIGSPTYLYYTLDGTYGAAKIFAASGFMCFGLFTTGVLLLMLIHHAQGSVAEVFLRATANMHGQLRHSARLWPCCRTIALVCRAVRAQAVVRRGAWPRQGRGAFHLCTAQVRVSC